MRDYRWRDRRYARYRARRPRSLGARVLFFLLVLALVLVVVSLL